MILTFEQAKKLNDLGFNDWTLYLFDSFYKTEHTAYDFVIQANKSEGYYKRPSVSDALQWIRDNKGIICGAYPIFVIWKNGVKEYFYEFKYVDGFGEEYFSKHFPTHPEAESALLDAVLTYLEK